MDFAEAALTVLREEDRPLHWTVIQDRALQRGYLDPFTQSDIRSHLLGALQALAREGRVRKEGRGVYALPEEPETSGVPTDL